MRTCLAFISPFHLCSQVINALPILLYLNPVYWDSLRIAWVQLIVLLMDILCCALPRACIPEPHHTNLPPVLIPHTQDDPRQFVPPTGQQWTILAAMKKPSETAHGPTYHNTFTRDSVDSRIWSIATEPKFGIGQRAMLLQTKHGNVLWDLIALLDAETMEFVRFRLSDIVRWQLGYQS